MTAYAQFWKYLAQKHAVSGAAPTREGYVFEGWATAADAATAEYQPGGAIRITGASRTLRAVWSAKSEDNDPADDPIDDPDDDDDLVGIPGDGAPLAPNTIPPSSVGWRGRSLCVRRTVYKKSTKFTKKRTLIALRSAAPKDIIEHRSDRSRVTAGGGDPKFTVRGPAADENS